MLLDNAANYIKSNQVQRQLRPALGNGLVTAEGTSWRSQRRTAAPMFQHRNVASLSFAMAAAAEEDDAGGRLVAPIPGQVTQVAAEPGMAVKRGQLMVVLEAMKTVFRLAAPADGVVATVSCQPGDSVVEGQVLVGFVEGDPATSTA